jgi:hypothetical protein
MDWHSSGITTSVLRLIGEERERSHAHGGRSVFGWGRPARPAIAAPEA